MNAQLKFYANLNNLVFSRDSSLYHSFSLSYKQSHKSTHDGWKFYKPFEEYERQGLCLTDENCKFRLTKLNKNFGLCATYPRETIIPRTITDEELSDASNFRTKNRFPVLSYVYKKNGNFASIWRSSQPKSGLTQNRSTNDEKLLKSIGDLSNKLIIYDARPYLNAQANRVHILFDLD